MNEFFYDSCTLILKFSIPGIFLAMVYDIFRLIRIGRNDLNHKPITALRKKYFPHMSDERKHKKMSEEWIVFTEDVLFWLIAAITEILAVYHINRGEIRIYCLMISVSGFFIYQRTFGKVFLFLSTKILYLLRYVFYGICCLVLSPSLFLWKILKRIGAYCKKHWKKHHVKNLF